MITSIKTKLVRLIKSLLKEGMSLEKISLCIALGVALGIFPVLGTTTVLCTVAALVLRLNLPAIQVVNYMVYPLQLVLLVPFYGAGGWLFGAGLRPGFAENLIGRLKTDFWGSMAGLWDSTLYAVAVWLIISPLLVFIIYGLLKPLIRRLHPAYGRPVSGSQDSS